MEPDNAVLDAPAPEAVADSASLEDLFGEEEVERPESPAPGVGLPLITESKASQEQHEHEEEPAARASEMDVMDALFGVDTADNAEPEESEPREEAVKLVAQGAPVATVEPAMVPFAKETQLLLAKLPNVVSIESRAFDHDSYAEEVERLVQDEAQGQRRPVRLTAENVIRWRWVEDETGQRKRQSNARLVRWPDGSTSLHLGSEVFGVIENPKDESDNNTLLFATSDGADPARAQAQALAQAQDPSGTQAYPLRKARGPIAGSIRFKASSIHSETHIKLKNKIAEKHMKVPKVKRAYAGIDQEALRAQEKISKDLELADRKRAKRQEKAARQRERAGTGPLTKGFLEEGLSLGDGDDEEEGSRSGRRGRARQLEDSDEEAARSERLLRIKRGGGRSRGKATNPDDELPSDEDEDLDEDETDESEDSDDGRRKSGKKGKKRKLEGKDSKSAKRAKPEPRVRLGLDAPGAADSEEDQDAEMPPVEDEDEGTIVKSRRKKRTLGGGDDD